MECNKYKEWFSPYYDGELEDAQAAQFIEHLRACASCKQEFARYTESLSALKSMAGDLDVPRIAQSVRETITENKESRAARWHQIVASDMKVVSEMLRPARGGLILLATVAAAALFVVVLAYTLTQPAVQVQPPSHTAALVPAPTAPAPITAREVSQDGMVRMNGQWLTEEDAFALLLKEKGYARHGDWLVPEPDATRLAMGLLPHEDGWLTPEELYRQLQPVPGPSESLAAQPQEQPKEAPVAPEEKEAVAQEPEAPVPAKEHKTEVVEAPKVKRNEVAAFLSTVLPDEVESHKRLTLISLTRQEREWEGKGSFYMTLADAVERGFAEIRETGTVSKLLVKKKPGVALFSVGGGIVIGGWQNRLIGPDIVLSSETTEAQIDVYCAEQGRWKGSRTFKVADYLAVSELRKKSYNGEIQSDIWSTISELRKSQNIHGGTSSSFTRLYEKRAIKKKISLYKRAFSAWKEKLKNKPHTVGIAVMVDGQIVGADLFVNNGLLMECYDHLVQTYAVEAALLQAKEEEQPAGDLLRKKVGEFIACAARSTYTSSGDSGYLEYKITDAKSDLYGYALTAERVPVHVSLFADGSGLEEAKVVARRPKELKKAGDVPGKQPGTTGQITPEEAAAAKLRREGKLGPQIPKPPAPAPKIPKLPKSNGNPQLPRNPVIPRLPGR